MARKRCFPSDTLAMHRCHGGVLAKVVATAAPVVRRQVSALAGFRLVPPFPGGAACLGPTEGPRPREDEAMTHYADYAESRADRAADPDDDQTTAIGAGLSAIAYALLDVAAAIREHTSAVEE